MITKRKVEWNFSKLTPIRESLVKFVTEKKQDWGRRGNAQKIMNNCRTAPFAKVSAGQGFLQMRQFIYPSKSGEKKHMFSPMLLLLN